MRLILLSCALIVTILLGVEASYWMRVAFKQKQTVSYESTPEKATEPVKVLKAVEDSPLKIKPSLGVIKPVVQPEVYRAPAVEPSFRSSQSLEYLAQLEEAVQMALASENEQEARDLYPRLEECARIGSESDNDFNQTEALMCLIGAGKLASRFPEALSDVFAQLMSEVPTSIKSVYQVSAR